MRKKYENYLLHINFLRQNSNNQSSALNAVEGKDEATGKNAIMELMKAVDETIPQPDRPKDKPFLMPVEDVFQLEEEQL